MSTDESGVTPAPWVRVCFRLESAAEERVLEWLQGEEALGSELEPTGGGTTEFRIYFSSGLESALHASIERLQASLGCSVSVCVEPVPDERWVENYQRGLEPFDVGNRFRVFPGDDRPPDGGADSSRVSLWITPGRAFGTGDHATTALCLEYLERELDPGAHVIDVGTGSGILAIAAVRLGAARVVAVEVDPEAASVARENLDRNRVSERVELVVGTTAAVSTGWFDLLTANLRSGILRETMQHLAYLLRPGGRGVLSGVLADEAQEVESAAVQRGLIPCGGQAQGEWVALEVKKKC